MESGCVVIMAVMQMMHSVLACRSKGFHEYLVAVDVENYPFAIAHISFSVSTFSFVNATCVMFKRTVSDLAQAAISSAMWFQ